MLSLHQKLAAAVINLVIYACYPRVFLTYWLKIFGLPNVALPHTVNEKYFWRKVFDRDPLFTVMADKLAVKEYLAQNFPDVPVAKVLWRGFDIRNCPSGLLRSRAILKANHSTSCLVRLGRDPVDLEEFDALTRRWLAKRPETPHGEWSYKYIVPELFVEKDVSRPDVPLMELSFMVAGDRFTYLLASINTKQHNQMERLYDFNFQATGARRLGHNCGLFPPRRRKLNVYPDLPDDFPLPPNVEEIAEMAVRVSGGRDDVRTDFMWNGETWYFGEFTFYPSGGYRRLTNPEILEEMSRAWDLRRSWLLAKPQTGWRKLYANWLRKALTLGDQGYRRT